MEVWESQVGVDTVASSQISFGHLQVEGETVFWTESRPLEKGRVAFLKKEKNLPSVELFPSMSVQSKVHEYGGGAFSVEKDQLIFFDQKTSSLYMQKEGSAPLCLIQDTSKRWADFSISSDLSKMICVCEDHSKEHEVSNFLVEFDLQKNSHSIIHQEFDFYASPRFSPDGTKIAFIFWNHPSMPWEESRLKIVSAQSKQEIFSIGGSKESIAEFIWTAPAEILFASDRNGFSNLYFWTVERETLLYKKEADFSYPLWVLGKSHFKSFVLDGEDVFVVAFCEKAIDSLGIIDRKTRTLHKLDLPYTVIRTLDVGSHGVYFIGGSQLQPLSLVCLDLKTLACEVISSSSTVPENLRPYISIPKEVATSSSLDGHKIFGFFYPPKNPSYDTPTLPPLIIKCHSGPTSYAGALLSWDVQFWTSRGFAFLDVNYRGSLGFGRVYQEALNYNWGILDVQDSLDLALSLTKSQLASPNALFAKGSSSGGFTALCMAAVSSDLKGCISYYGVTDLSLLAEETHKFEKHYLDSLIGNYKEFKTRYAARSPNERAKEISCPVLFLHGDQDFVVPLSQAELLHKKLPNSELIVLQGEGHGFRKAETIKACLEAEARFYKKIISLSGKNL